MRFRLNCSTFGPLNAPMSSCIALVTLGLHAFKTPLPVADFWTLAVRSDCSAASCLGLPAATQFSKNVTELSASLSTDVRGESAASNAVNCSASSL